MNLNQDPFFRMSKEMKFSKVNSYSLCNYCIETMTGHVHRFLESIVRTFAYTWQSDIAYSGGDWPLI